MPQMTESVAALHPVARLLPPEEWAAKTPEFASLPPDHSLVVVVEDGGPAGRVLAQWGAMTVVHVEGLEMAEDVQGHAGVARALLSLMVESLLTKGIVEVLTQATTPSVERLIQSAGGRQVPGTTWVIPLTPEG